MLKKCGHKCGHKFILFISNNKINLPTFVVEKNYVITNGKHLPYKPIYPIEKREP